MILNNKPLVEAIFEVKWGLEAQSTGLLQDPIYEILIGSFYGSIKADFPHWEKLPISSVPANLVPHRPQHQFRASAGGWPLVQLGPGIMTVNDTEGYTWETFKAQCLRMFTILKQCYEGHSFVIKEIQLRYIDADPLIGQSPTEFLSNLGVSVTVPSKLYLENVVDSIARDLSLNISFPINKPKGVGALTFSSGEKEGEPALIWETIIQSSGDDAQVLNADCEAWLTDAHFITHDWFITLIGDKLLEKYK